MKEVKLNSLLACISIKEFNNLGNFVTSRIFNSNKSVVKLYNYISSNYDAFMSGKISKYDIFRNVFENEKYNESKYWKISHALSAVIDKYLSFIEYDTDYFYQKNLLLEAYRMRNVSKQYNFLSKEILKSFDTEYNKGLNFFLNQTHYYFQNISYLGADNIQNLDKEIEGLFESLSIFFIMTNITSIGIISNLKTDYVETAKKEIWMFDEILSYLERHKNKFKRKYITVYIFFILVLAKINYDQEKYYFEAKKLIFSRMGKFSRNLTKHMLVNLLDYSVSKMVKGNEKFLKEIFLINKLMDEHSIKLSGEYIHGHNYYSVIEHATMLKENKWAKDFGSKYKEYLSNEFKDSSYNLGQARIYFENKDYSTSMSLLLKVDNIDSYFYLSHKILLIQNYYEVKDNEALNLILETLSKYLKRRIDISDEIKQNYIKFLYYFRKLKNVANKKIYLLENLNKEIQTEVFFLQKKWIQEKIIELKHESK